MCGWRKLLLRGASIGIGGCVVYVADQLDLRRRRHVEFLGLEERFNEEIGSREDSLASRAVGGFGNDPGITHPAKLHRFDSLSSHQYPGKPITRKTGVKTQCVSIISAENNAGLFPGAGDLYLLTQDSVARDIYGFPTIYSGDAATQLKTTRPLDLSEPKTTTVAYLRRLPHPPKGTPRRGGTDRLSPKQLRQLSELARFDQHGRYNEVVADLQGRQLCGSFLFLKDPDDPVERAEKEGDLIRQRMLHRLIAGSRAIDKLPVIEIRRKLTGRFEMIEREDLASMSVLVHHRHVLGTTPTDDREDYLTKMLTSLYFARSPAKEAPFTPPNTTTLFYAKFLMVSSVGKLPISTIREINQDIDELVAQAERERQAKKEKFRFYQSVLAEWNLGARLEYESAIANHDFQRKLVKIEDDGLRKYDLDYASSSALFRLKVQRGDTTSWLVVAPVGFNQNWRFPEEVVGGVPKRSLKPRVFEVDEAESQEPGGPTKE